MHKIDGDPTMKIKKASFRHYRCLKGVKIGFEPLTVLVGPNGSGKSSVLRALLPDPLNADDVWQLKRDIDVSVDLTFPDGSLSKVFRRGSSAVSGVAHSAQLLHLDLSRLRSPNTVSSAPMLDSNGGNLTNAFATLSRSEQGELASQFSRLIPALQDVNARPLGSGNQHCSSRIAGTRTSGTRPRRSPTGRCSCSPTSCFSTSVPRSTCS